MKYASEKSLSYKQQDFLFFEGLVLYNYTEDNSWCSLMYELLVWAKFHWNFSRLFKISMGL